MQVKFIQVKFIQVKFIQVKKHHITFNEYSIVKLLNFYTTM